MNNIQFFERVQKNGDYKTKVEAETAIQAFTEAVTEALVAREDISLEGFGDFLAYLRKGKSERVPGTDKIYRTQDKMVPMFKANALLKDRVAAVK